MIEIAQSADDSASLLPDLTPLLDVMFIVLVFLLLNMQTLPKAISLDLPRDRDKVSQAIAQQSVLTLGIDSHAHRWLLNEHAYGSLAGLQEAAQQAFAQYPNKPLVIAADKKVPLQDFMSVITWLQAQHKTAYSVLMDDAS